MTFGYCAKLIEETQYMWKTKLHSQESWPTDFSTKLIKYLFKNIKRLAESRSTKLNCKQIFKHRRVKHPQQKYTTQILFQFGQQQLLQILHLE